MRAVNPGAVAVVFMFVSTIATSAQEMRRIDVSKLGPQVGQTIPDFTLPDQHGTKRTLQSIMGPKGAMIVF
jgi:cytochrome oxidase Cu insertion factor (SCO1/SenC/PrrC family)